MRSSNDARRLPGSAVTVVRITLALAACMTVATPTYADAESANEPADSGGIAEVTVTATRREETVSRVPVSLSVLTQESMDVKGVKDFSDVARLTPGVA